MEHISASQINMYLKCSQQWAFRYIEGFKSPPGAALTLGSCFHGATGKNYEQKIESREDLPVGDVCDVFSTQFEHAKHETAWFEDEKPGEVKDTVIETLREYQKVISPGVQPEQVEMKFQLNFTNLEAKFIGYVDLLDEKGLIIETKTTSRKPSEISHDHKLQTTAYSVGYRTKYKKQESGARIDYAINKKNPEIVSMPLEITARDMDYFLTIVPMVLASMKAGVFIPNRGHFLCSQRWCGYAELCMKRNGGLVK